MCWNIVLVLNILLMVTQPVTYNRHGKTLLVLFNLFSWGSPFLVFFVALALGLVGPASDGSCFLKSPADLVSLVFLGALVILLLCTMFISARKLGMHFRGINGAEKTKNIREMFVFVLAFVVSLVWTLCYEVADSVSASWLVSPLQTYFVLAGSFTLGLMGFVDCVVWYHVLYRSGQAQRGDEEGPESDLMSGPSTMKESTLAFESGIEDE